MDNRFIEISNADRSHTIKMNVYGDDYMSVETDCGCWCSVEMIEQTGKADVYGHKGCNRYPNCQWPRQWIIEQAQGIFDDMMVDAEPIE